MVKKAVKVPVSFFLLILPILFVIAGCADIQKAKNANMAGNHTEARRNLTVLVDKGFPQAKTMLAQMYLKGQGVPADPAKAMRLLKQVEAEEQYPAVILMIGKIYRDGLGVPRNTALAKKYFKRALASGDVNAYLQLGRLEQEAGNFSVAEDYFRAALNHQNIKAWDYFGKLYILEALQLAISGCMPILGVFICVEESRYRRKSNLLNI